MVRQFYVEKHFGPNNIYIYIYHYICTLSNTSIYTYIYILYTHTFSLSLYIYIIHTHTLVLVISCEFVSSPFFTCRQVLLSGARPRCSTGQGLGCHKIHKVTGKSDDHWWSMDWFSWENPIFFSIFPIFFHGFFPLINRKPWIFSHFFYGAFL